MTTTPDTADAQVAALRRELQQREATIEQLAAQLCEAADRLDVLSRGQSETSARTPREKTHAGGHPGEWGGSLSRQFAEFFSQWQDLDLGAALDNIDRRLGDLCRRTIGSSIAVDAAEQEEPTHTRCESRNESPASGFLLSAFLQADHSEQHPTAEASQGESPRYSEPRSSKNGLAPPAGLTGSADSTAETDAPPYEDPHALPAPLPDFPVPGPIDLDTASVEMLRQGIRERDDCLLKLIARLRVAETDRVKTPNWEALAEVPGMLLERLRMLEDDLHQRIRQEELELSIERARLSRDERHLSQVRAELEKRILSLGLPAGQGNGSQGEEKSQKSLRNLFKRG